MMKIHFVKEPNSLLGTLCREDLLSSRVLVSAFGEGKHRPSSGDGPHMSPSYP